MKRILFILALVMATVASAQISTIKVAEKKEVRTILPYDSTKNCLGGDNVFAYKGQELFVMPNKNSYDYDHFHTIDFDPINESEVYKKYGTTKTYQYRTPYELLVNKTFVVDSVSLVSKEYSSEKYAFYLTEKENPNVRCIYMYDPNFVSMFPFTTMAYYNYLLENTKGRSFVIGNKEIHDSDVYTGEEIVTKGDYSEWVVIDITIEEESCELVALLNNGKQTTYCDAKALLKKEGKRRIFSKEEWDSLVAEYGLTFMEDVMSGTIRVGMAEALIYMSWGNPKKINRNSYGRNQWVYENQYLYVENGRVTAWN